MLTQYTPACSIAVTDLVPLVDTFVGLLLLLQIVPFGVPIPSPRVTSGGTDSPLTLTSVAFTVPYTAMLNE